MAVNQYVYDDGSVIGWDETGLVQSKEIGSNVWVDDAQPAPAGWNVFSTDTQEQKRLSAGYPANGQPWSENAALLGVSRLIDTAARSYATVKGSTPASYAGQNGRTYENGQTTARKPGGGMEMLLIIGAAFLVLG
jgi:hypothetical protein